MWGDRQQDTGSRHQGSHQEVWCLHQISLRDVVEAVRSSAHPSSSSWRNTLQGLPRCPPATVRCSPSPKWKVGSSVETACTPANWGLPVCLWQRPELSSNISVHESFFVFFFKTRINFRKSHCEQHEATGISQALNFKSMMPYLWVLTSRLKIHFLYMSDVRCFTWMLGCFISLVIRQRWQICSVAFKWLRYWRTDFWEWARLAKAVPKIYWSLGRVLSCYCSRDSPRTLPRVPIITGCRSLCLKCQRIMPGQLGHEPSSKRVIGGPIKRSVAVSFSLPHSLMLGLTGSPLSRLKIPLICRSAGISCWHH